MVVIGLIVAVVELAIIIKRKATKKTTKNMKGNLHIFRDLKEAMKNTKERKAAEAEATAAV